MAWARAQLGRQAARRGGDAVLRAGDAVIPGRRCGVARRPLEVGRSGSRRSRRRCSSDVARRRRPRGRRRARRGGEEPGSSAARTPWTMRSARARKRLQTIAAPGPRPWTVSADASARGEMLAKARREAASRRQSSARCGRAGEERLQFMLAFGRRAREDYRQPDGNPKSRGRRPLLHDASRLPPIELCGRLNQGRRGARRRQPLARSVIDVS